MVYRGRHGPFIDCRAAAPGQDHIRTGIGDEENMEDGYVNFSVLIFRFTSLEFLYLKSSGHRRAIHSWDEDYSCTWLVP